MLNIYENYWSKCFLVYSRATPRQGEMVQMLYTLYFFIELFCIKYQIFRNLTAFLSSGRLQKADKFSKNSNLYKKHMMLGPSILNRYTTYGSINFILQQYTCFSSLCHILFNKYIICNKRTVLGLPENSLIALI